MYANWKRPIGSGEIGKLTGTSKQQGGSALARRASPGNALMLIGVGHAVWGLIAYRKPLQEIARAGIVDSVGDGIFRRANSDDARAAGFWFMFTAPLVGILGYLVEQASRAGDAQALKVSGRAVIAVGAIGATVMPRSGFVAAFPVGYWVIRQGARGGPFEH